MVTPADNGNVGEELLVTALSDVGFCVWGERFDAEWVVEQFLVKREK